MFTERPIHACGRCERQAKAAKQALVNGNSNSAVSTMLSLILGLNRATAVQKKSSLHIVQRVRLLLHACAGGVAAVSVSLVFCSAD
jgi:thioredoxin reductase